jgi:hypothetical protein
MDASNGTTLSWERNRVLNYQEAAHAIDPFDMHQKYADVLPLAEVLDSLTGWRAEQDRRAAQRTGAF